MLNVRQNTMQSWLRRLAKNTVLLMVTVPLRAKISDSLVESASLSYYNEYSAAYLPSLLLSSFTSLSKNHCFTYNTIVGNNDSTVSIINSVLLEYGACK